MGAHGLLVPQDVNLIPHGPLGLVKRPYEVQVLLFHILRLALCLQLHECVALRQHVGKHVCVHFYLQLIERSMESPDNFPDLNRVLFRIILQMIEGGGWLQVGRVCPLFVVESLRYRAVFEVRHMNNSTASEGIHYSRMSKGRVKPPVFVIGNTTDDSLET